MSFEPSKMSGPPKPDLNEKPSGSGLRKRDLPIEENVAHDYRSPLNGSNSFNETLPSKKYHQNHEDIDDEKIVTKKGIKENIESEGNEKKSHFVSYVPGYEVGYIHTDDEEEVPFEENNVTVYCTYKRRVKTKQLCMYLIGIPTYKVSATVTVPKHSSENTTNESKDKEESANVISQELSEKKDVVKDCVLEYRYGGQLYPWNRTYMHEPTPNYDEIARRLNGQRQRRGSFFHPERVRPSEGRRHRQAGRVTNENGVITRVVWNRSGPRTVVIGRPAQERQRNLDDFIRRVNAYPMEYDSEIDDYDDYLETVRAVTMSNSRPTINGEPSTSSGRTDSTFHDPPLLANAQETTVENNSGEDNSQKTVKTTLPDEEKSRE
uniref:Btz domain-containing protein n=1 Tax=Parastrongyloides trichosuri TaxID=131310 RepID=A0A0N4ZHQ1_PARTI